MFADATRGDGLHVAASGISRPQRTVLYGESLGTGVAVRLAWEHAKQAPVAAVVLETPYTSIAEVAQRHYPFVPARWLVKDRFDSLSLIAAIGAPVLMLHSEDDRVIPFAVAQELFRKSRRTQGEALVFRGAATRAFTTTVHAKSSLISLRKYAAGS